MPMKRYFEIGKLPRDKQIAALRHLHRRGLLSDEDLEVRLRFFDDPTHLSLSSFVDEKKTKRSKLTCGHDVSLIGKDPSDDKIEICLECSRLIT